MRVHGDDGHEIVYDQVPHRFGDFRIHQADSGHLLQGPRVALGHAGLTGLFADALRRASGLYGPGAVANGTCRC